MIRSYDVEDEFLDDEAFNEDMENFTVEELYEYLDWLDVLDDYPEDEEFN